MKWLASLNMNLAQGVVRVVKIVGVTILLGMMMVALIAMGAVITSFLVDFGYALRMFL